MRHRIRAGGRQLAELKEQGFKVRVLHEIAEPFVLGHGYVERMVSRVWILDPADPTEQVLAYGEAICSDKDSFDRRLGLTIAVGRAKKDLGDRVRAAL